jgi:hypothetical protein
MRKTLLLSALLVSSATSIFAVSKPHVISFGKWQSAKWLVGAAEDKPMELKIRALFVDTKLKEYTVGLPHDITDRLFAVRRVFHLNDNLPDEKAPSPRWLWQRGAWLLVDRATGRISLLALPDFDTYSSAAAWYRDYIAYCGVSENGGKLFAIVMQVGRRKPVLRKALGEPSAQDAPDSACDEPVWERQPARVSFAEKEGQRMVFSIRRRSLDIVNDTDGDEESVD